MKKLFCCVASVIFTSLIFSCGSAPKNQVAEEPETSYEADPSEAVSIALPPKKEKNYFAGVLPEAVTAVEKGCPDSINQAWTILRKEPDAYSEAEKVLLNTGYAMMSILWPEETANFQPFEIDSQNPYSGAIESAKRGIYDESTGEYDFLTKLLPSLVLVTSSSRNDYYSLAEKSLDSVLELNGESVAANYLRGILYRRLGNNDKALKYFQKAYDNCTQCTETLFGLADCNFRNGNYDTALEQAKIIVEKNQFYRPALKLCAETCFAAGKIEECEQFVARVLQQEPENGYYVLFRAKILIQKGDFIRAASLLDVYGRTDSENKEYLVLRTKVQKDWNKNMTAAAATAEKALSLYPEDEEIILTAAGLAADTGTKINGFSAEELASIILEKDSSNMQALIIKMNQLVQQKKWTEAYSVSSSLTQMKKAPVETVYTHINICLNAKKTEEAWTLSSALYNQNPKDEVVLQNYIKVLVATGRTSEASRLIGQNLPNSSAKMKSFLLLERSYLQGTEDGVLVDLRASLTANPRNKDALFRLYQIYFNKKEYRKAQYYLKQVVALSPSDESLLRLNTELETLLSK